MGEPKRGFFSAFGWFPVHCPGNFRAGAKRQAISKNLCDFNRFPTANRRLLYRCPPSRGAVPEPVASMYFPTLLINRLGTNYTQKQQNYLLIVG